MITSESLAESNVGSEGIDGCAAPGSAPRIGQCTHRFVRENDSPHYCTYIQIDALAQTVPPWLKTSDDWLVYSLAASACLYLNVVGCDLGAISQAALDAPLIGQFHEVVKRLGRVAAMLDIVIESCHAVSSRLAHRASRRSFSLRMPLDELPGLADAYFAIHAIQRAMGDPSDHAAGGAANTHDDLAMRIADVERRITLLDSACTELAIALRSVAGPRKMLSDLFDRQELLQAARQTLLRHHSQASAQGTSHDELTFITAHQVFEVWFPTALSYVDDAIAQLLQPAPRIVEATRDVQMVTMIYRLFGAMIRIPQTMSAADYMAFRSQLQAGSGAESIGFRLLEAALGQRDAHWLAALRRMRLMADQIEARLAEPSLHDAFLQALRSQDLADTSAMPLAESIAGWTLPTGAPNPLADWVYLAESLLDLEQAYDTWRLTHLAMVDRMIGYRK